MEQLVNSIDYKFGNTVKGKVPKKIHTRLANSNSADSDPRTEQPLFPLRPTAKPTLKMDGLKN